MRYLLLPIVVVLMLSLASCSRQSTGTKPTDIQIAETLIYNHQDSFYTNPQEAEQHLTRVLKQLSDTSARKRLQLFIGMERMFQGDNQGFQKNIDDVRQYCQSHPDDKSLSGLYWNDCGIANMLSGNRDSAITCFESANHDFVLAKDTARAGDVSINLAGLLRERGDMAWAARVLQQALVLLQGKSKRPATIRFAVLYMLGAVYSDMYSFNIADTYFKQAAQNIGDANLNDQYMFYNARGNRYFFGKKYTQAWNDFSESKKIAQQLNNPAFVAIAESNQGEILHNQGKNSQAMPLLLNAEQTIAKSGGGDPRSAAYLNDLIASVMAHNGDLSGARARFRSTDTSAIAKEPRYMMTHYERLADFHHLTGDNASAYNDLEQARLYES